MPKHYNSSMVRIGITETDLAKKNLFYHNWIKNNDENINTILLSCNENNLNDLEQCDAIVLSGGVDIHPSFYNNARTDYPNAPESFLQERDKFETAVFNYANKNKLPVLAICRGMQLVNTILQGDLLQDLEESGKNNHSAIDGQDQHHKILVEKSSLLFQITGTEYGEINSAHHQVLDKVSEDLIITAFSPDGVPEAAEYKDKSDKPFLLCVQWHPERLRMNELSIPFTKNIREVFLQSIKK